MVENTEFSGYVSVSQYNHVHDSAFKGGMVWANNGTSYDNLGLTDCTIATTASFTGTSSAPLRMDGYTNYFFKTGPGTLGTNTIKQIFDDATCASIQALAQAASIASTVLYVPILAGTYQISVYMNNASAITGGTVTCTIGWADGVITQTAVTSTISLVTAGSYVQNIFNIQVTAGSNITYLTTVTSAVGTPSYNLYINAVNVT